MTDLDRLVALAAKWLRGAVLPETDERECMEAIPTLVARVRGLEEQCARICVDHAILKWDPTCPYCVLVAEHQAREQAEAALADAIQSRDEAEDQVIFVHEKLQRAEAALADAQATVEMLQEHYRTCIDCFECLKECHLGLAVEIEQAQTPITHRNLVPRADLQRAEAALAEAEKKLADLGEIADESPEEYEALVAENRRLRLAVSGYETDTMQHGEPVHLAQRLQEYMEALQRAEARIAELERELGR